MECTKPFNPEQEVRNRLKQALEMTGHKAVQEAIGIAVAVQTGHYRDIKEWQALRDEAMSIIHPQSSNS